MTVIIIYISDHFSFLYRCLWVLQFEVSSDRELCFIIPWFRSYILYLNDFVFSLSLITWALEGYLDSLLVTAVPNSRSEMSYILNCLLPPVLTFRNFITIRLVYFTTTGTRTRLDCNSWHITTILIVFLCFIFSFSSVFWLHESDMFVHGMALIA